ncbi:MAG: type II secretion system protein M [Gammaproteobacteria bacterium]|nr:type II secretion system protein M [Gammaproteobacteria bacterium]
MKEWFAGLETRDQNALIVGGCLLLATIIYLYLWQPFLHNHQRMQGVVAEQRSLAAWMQAAATDVRHLRSRNTPRIKQGSKQSLLAIVDRTTKAADLGSSIKRIEPEGVDGVRVWLNSAEFDKAIMWLTGLQKTYRVKTVSIAVEATDTPGLVNIRMSLSLP